MAIEFLKEKCASPVNILEIGSAKTGIVRVGGESCLPFLFEEGAMPNAPVVTMEIADCKGDDTSPFLLEQFAGTVDDPVKCAKHCVKTYGLKILCVRLQSIHPDYGSRSADEAAAIVKKIYDEVKVPLIVVGCGDDDRDNDVLPKVSQELKGANCLFGVATQNNYKTLAATCLADGHSIIAESPIDVNIAKQVNILIGDMGFDPARIVMHPTTTSLGYGMEYVYSIMERSRLAAFIGDKMLAMPFILFVGLEAWKTKEAKEFSKAQGVNWEIATAVAMLQSGADILAMRSPDATRSVTKYINELMKK